MREIAKKADSALLEKIQNGSISINKAHEMIKAAEARKKVGVVEDDSEEKTSNTGKGIMIHSNSVFFSFCQNLKKVERKVRF